MAEYLGGGEQSFPPIDDIRHDEGFDYDQYAADLDSEHASFTVPDFDLLPTELAPDIDGPAEPAQIYLENLYSSLGFETKPTADQLQQLWEAVDPEDRLQRTYIIEALRGHRIGFNDLSDLPDNTHFTLLWGGDFQGLLEDIQTEKVYKNGLTDDPVLDGIFSD
jgi:hypothetical protein